MNVSSIIQRAWLCRAAIKFVQPFSFGVIHSAAVPPADHTEHFTCYSLCLDEGKKRLALWERKKLENIRSNLGKCPWVIFVLFRPDTHQMCRRTNLGGGILWQAEYSGNRTNVYLTITFVRKQKNNPCRILMRYLHLSYHINMHRAKSKSDKTR